MRTQCKVPDVAKKYHGKGATFTATFLMVSCMTSDCNSNHFRFNRRFRRLIFFYILQHFITFKSPVRDAPHWMHELCDWGTSTSW